MSTKAADDDLMRRSAELSDTPQLHMRRILSEVPPGHLVTPPPEKPLMEMSNYEVGWMLAYDEQQHRQRVARARGRRARVGWLVQGVVTAAIILGILAAIYAALGPQKWMPVGGFVWAAAMRGWWRTQPKF